MWDRGKRQKFQSLPLIALEGHNRPLDDEAYSKPASDPKLPFLSCKLSLESRCPHRTQHT